MAQSRIIVRPKRQALPRVQHWLVYGRGWNLTFQCTEGGFFAACRQVGIIDAADRLEAGTMRRELISTVR